MENRFTSMIPGLRGLLLTERLAKKSSSATEKKSKSIDQRIKPQPEGK